MIYFVGAGSGAPDLITVRGARLLSEADVIVYAGSLVNPALLEYKKDGCEVYNSAKTPRYLVFFKGRDADALTAAFKEFSAKKLTHTRKSILLQLPIPLQSLRAYAQ